MGVPAYDIHALEVTLGGRRVLGPLDLRLEPGSFVGILGPNGSGKTTLLRTLTGALRPTAGEVLCTAGPSIATGPPSWHARSVSFHNISI